MNNFFEDYQIHLLLYVHTHFIISLKYAWA
jgi:hypothetical protein